MSDSKGQGTPSKTSGTSKGSTGAGDDKQGVAGQGSDQRPASHLDPNKGKS